MIKALLFDVDGVILFPLSTYFSDRLAAKLSIPADSINRFFEGPYQDCLVGKQAIAPYMSQWGWTGTVDELLEFWFGVEAEIDHDLISYIDNLRLKGLRCYVATNQEKYRAEYMFEKIGFNGSFDTLYAAGHVGVAKPDLAFFQYVLDDNPDIRPDEMLFWDDQLKNVEGARQAGITAELYAGLDDFKSKMKGYVNR